MITPAIPAQEEDRLKALRRLMILDTSPEERFDRITSIVKSVFKVNIVLVSLVDFNRQWFKSCVGLDVSETSREVSFCAHAINSPKPFIIPDTLKDIRFYDNPLVTNAPFIRFYAGITLNSKNNYALGTLCIIDDKPRELTQEEVSLLQELAKLVEGEINNQEIFEAHKRIRESEKRYYTLVETLEEGIILQHQTSKILAMNSSAQQILGLNQEQMMSFSSMNSNLKIIHEDGSAFTDKDQPISECLRTGKPQSNVIMGVYRPDDSIVWISFNAVPLFNEEILDNENDVGQPTGNIGPTLPYAVVASFVDISWHKEKADRLAHQAYHDNLTGLPNRVLFRDRLRTSLEVAGEKQQIVAVGFIDLDHFKQVNDTLGHAIGDALLIEAARRMKSCLRASDTVARLGGDEFAIILDAVGSKERAAIIAGKLVEILSQEFILNNNKLKISGSIGISLYPLDSLNLEELVKQADSAMYQAKSNGKNTFRVYESTSS